jgi:methyltransferase-like protein 23
MQLPNANPATTDADERTLHTPAGDVRLDEYRLGLDGHEWRILHTGSVISFADEQRFLSEPRDRVPYGVLLWPAAIALAHDLVARGDALRGRTILELGAGTGLPGIVAATLGARVVQTDRQEPALDVCRRNAVRNAARGIEHRAADWAAWTDDARYDIILGSDVMYADTMHEHLRRIFETNLAPNGRVLLSDPFRKLSLRLLETLEVDGWSVAMSRWTVAAGGAPRAIGVFELAAPAVGHA